VLLVVIHDEHNREVLLVKEVIEIQW
jgi:hypothetical protein